MGEKSTQKRGGKRVRQRGGNRPGGSRFYLLARSVFAAKLFEGLPPMSRQFRGLGFALSGGPTG